ncbi:NTP transferase domain-containing protein [Agromyces sp. MMS24-K17]|uniref:nucleotidyltransferase family protein n=1 Tax=Agromyces sp. MMS24-K17 TaxID=3372850 RepID=UPI003753F087
MTDRLVGVLLAAGAGSRMGGPKALVRDAITGEPWTVGAVRMLRDAGCGRVIVVLGGGADEARALLARDSGSGVDGIDSAVEVVVAEDWASGLAASFRAGLRAAATTTADAALLTLVDLPGLPPAAGARVVAAAGPDLAGAAARAVYDGRPGHPVLIGRDHWTEAAAAVHGDAGAGAWLRAVGAIEVECGDLADGRDRDSR